MVELAIAPRGAKLPAAVTELAATIEADGGLALAAYQEPIGDHWHLFAMLPLAKVDATPYQRDLSPAHLKRMIEVMKKLDRFTEPIVAVHSAGTYWTPNGNHRRAAAVKSGAKTIPAIVIPDPEVAFQSSTYWVGCEFCKLPSAATNCAAPPVIVSSAAPPNLWRK